uniref:RAB11 family interacting protein 5b (class I) n=1 Tax=Tetraodon nigroviridis TaxID=99883 RepID=H3DE71_TETNG
QRWVPTHVNVTVLRARGLRTKGKHGSRYLYTIIQVGKEKYTTGLVEKVEVPEWNEECSFELLPGILEDGGRGAYPPGSADLVLTVMHRVLIGLDVFLGQAVIPLDKIFQEGMCPRGCRWFKLNSKCGRKEKERGGLQVTVQFTRNNMTASMFDLTIKDKPRSVFGKLKDRVTGRKRGDVESSSAILPGGTLGQPDVEITEEKKSKMKEFLKGKLRKSSDSRSCASLASESGPAVRPTQLTRLHHQSESRRSLRRGGSGQKSQHTTKVLTHKRAFSDEASKIKTPFFPTNPTMESLKGHTMTQSKSSVCINGSHVYDSEPSTPRSSAAHPCKLVLLEKCAPLSRSLQNLTKRTEDRGTFAESSQISKSKSSSDTVKNESSFTRATNGVTSARIKPKCAPQRSSGSSPKNQNNRENGEFEQLLSLVQSISGANEGPLSYQPVKSALCSILASKNQSNLQRDHANEDQAQPGVESDSEPANNNTPNSSQVVSRTHPVKPLTSSQSEKKQATAEPQKSQGYAAKKEVSEARLARYQHLTNMELISLLLQQKCEAELKKVKSQVRDLEDYIDNLLLRIMEQTPTLLQVRSRHNFSW